LTSDEARALIRYGLVGLLLTVLFGWTLVLARDAILIIYISALFAIGLSPLVNAIERHRPAAPRRVPRWAAILVIYLVIIGVLVAVAIMVVPPLIAQARELSASLPMLMHKAQQWLIDRGLLSQELTFSEAVQKTPVGSSDAVGTIVGAVWGVIGGVFGAVTILIRFTNRSASHLELAAACGNTSPNTMPSTIAAMTQKYSCWTHGLRVAVAVDMPHSL